jgi:uncharacterized protein DUF6798
LKNYPILRNAIILAVLAACGLLIAGYHPGAEDDGVYLSAIKRDLNPALYPHDSDFFSVQLQATIFDKVMAASVRLTHAPLGWVIFAWHYLTIYLVLLGCWRLSRRCFPEEYAQWASTTLVAVLLTLPVAGSALYIIDQNLHPRALATAAILAAIVATLDRKFVLSVGLLVVAALFHPIMATFGISFCIFLAWRPPMIGTRASILALTPLGWIFEPTSPAWRVAANTRDYYFLGRWEWYDWLGVFAPFAILWWFRRIGQRDKATTLVYVTSRLMLFGTFQLIVAVALMLPQSLERVRPLQPMRYLHLFYLIFIILSGGLLSQNFLRNHWLRWVVIFVPLATGMYFAQRETYPSSAHLEWPGSVPKNPWLKAFAWIRENTPPDAYFAAGPDYMRRPGDDYHSFRALAERSVLADAVKDSAVATQVPRLSQRWLEEVEAERGWEHFGPDDFARLKKRFGVDWVLIEQPGMEGVECPYKSVELRVCQVP